jgi:hypothetical protein
MLPIHMYAQMAVVEIPECVRHHLFRLHPAAPSASGASDSDDVAVPTSLHSKVLQVVIVFATACAQAVVWLQTGCVDAFSLQKEFSQHKAHRVLGHRLRGGRHRCSGHVGTALFWMSTYLICTPVCMLLMCMSYMLTCGFGVRVGLLALRTSRGVPGEVPGRSIVRPNISGTVQ